MSISKAIKNKDLPLLIKTVNKAVKKYKAKQPAEPSVETVNGPMLLSMAAAIDKKSVWIFAIQAYTEIVNATASIPKSNDRVVEISKLIASNPTLRTLANTKSSSSDGLL